MRGMKKIIFGEHKNLIHENLKQIRRSKVVSQSELAARMQVLSVNMDQQMISKIEHDDRIVTDYELVCFAKALKVDVTALLGEFPE